MNRPFVSIVLPCYNEEEVLSMSICKLQRVIKKLIQKECISPMSFLCFIDDGSIDRTWQVIEYAVNSNTNIKGIKLSRNFGHQCAILAGMMQFRTEVDCVITMDVDLQDDLNVIEKMISDYTNGHEIVYGVRRNRPADGFLKKQTALLYYRLLSLLGIESVYNHADFRLVGSNVLTALSNYKESNLFLRGLFPVLGFNTSVQYYDRQERLTGCSKYTLRKMLTLAVDGITSFSAKPLKYAFVVGLIIVLLSIVGIGWAAYQKTMDKTIPGWASIVIPIYFIGGVQMFFLGIIGEYIGKTYLEAKNRPRYLVEEEI